MGYIVKCPNCGEINSGSRLTCTHCDSDLVGIPREEDKSEMPLPVDMPAIPIASNPVKKVNHSHVLVGLLVGFTGFIVLSFFTAGSNLCCGLVISLVMGILAGLFTAKYADPGPIEKIARLGAIAGLIAGIFAMLGQIFGGLFLPAAFGFMQTLNYPLEDLSTTVNELMLWSFWPGVINGVLGLLVSTGMGAFTARWKST